MRVVQYNREQTLHLYERLFGLCKITGNSVDCKAGQKCDCPSCKSYQEACERWEKNEEDDDQDW